MNTKTMPSPFHYGCGFGKDFAGIFKAMYASPSGAVPAGNCAKMETRESQTGKVTERTMKTKTRIFLGFPVLLALLAGLPLLGVWLDAKPVAQYAGFPPMTRYVPHAGFSWAVFDAFAAVILLVLLTTVFRRLTTTPKIPAVRAATPEKSSRQNPVVSPFPFWGWIGIFAGVGTWVLAWNRFPWAASFQEYTFSPLWLAYIVVINALTKMRTGRCMLTDRTRYFLWLFPVSAIFWWFFEYLNRFAQNWYYAGADTMTSLEYFVSASLPFATVLPAVLGTYELLQTLPRLGAGFANFPRVAIPRPRPLAWLALACACAGLTGIGVWPDYLFPMLWIAPLTIIIALQVITGRKTVLSGLRDGDWRTFFLLAFAALICGFFWEMWNFKSLAKWVYAVPFVNRFHVFEMPLLGFAGYLPFGLECGAVGLLVAELGASQNHEPGLSPVGIRRCGNAFIFSALAFYFFILPGFILIHDLADPKLSGPGIPDVAWRVHRALTPRYEKWARDRVASGQASHLALHDVPSTEWPMFGSVFYLAATENLQDAWEKDHALAPIAPAVYARKTIDAATDLILDPNHHAWVKNHWGADYMHKENVFFRSMIIQALTSRENLLKDGKHMDILRDQVETLSAALDASPLGVLNDYPGECYPIDVFAAIASIRRADKILGTDHSAFVTRALRGFQGDMLDKRGLVPYSVNARTGCHHEPSRGIGNSYVLIYAPGLYPDVAKTWYAQYEKYFWQERMGCAGFREFPNNLPDRAFFSYDVDSGPILDDFSIAGNAYAIAACKVNGRFDRAFTIASQGLAASWCLPDGTLIGARLLSNLQHAPYLGEANMLFLLTRQPAPGVTPVTGGHVPRIVYIGLLVFWGIGATLIFLNIRNVRQPAERGIVSSPHTDRRQLAVWIGLLAIALVLFGAGYGMWAVVTLLVAQILPRPTRA